MPKSAVMKLMEKWLYQYKSLYVDNIYTGIPLGKQLMSQKTYLCESLGCNRRHLHLAGTTAKSLPRQSMTQHCGNIIKVEELNGH